MELEQKVLFDQRLGARNILALALMSLVVGGAAGVLGAIFRLTLQKADWARTTLILLAHQQGSTGFLMVVGGITAATALAAWLVRRFSPESGGSGIPHVESQLKLGWSGSPERILPVKFVGGVLAIGGGLALGREGPSVQIGASLGHLLGKIFRRNENECRVLLAAGAGAGLATAFNAPVAGVIFVLEELVGAFDLPVMITTLGASAGAIAISRHMLGNAPDFLLGPITYSSLRALPVHVGLGIVIGVLGVGYDHAILGLLRATGKLRNWEIEWRGALVGAAIGIVAWFLPGMAGGGDNITQQVLNGGLPLTALVAAFALRFIMGPVSYAARTPGGLFAPLLTVGSQCGLLFGTLLYRWFGATATQPSEFAIVGMAALFAAVVRAPVTGIVLVVELTGSFSLFLPMLAASFCAMTVATSLKQRPIYDALRELKM